MPSLRLTILLFSCTRKERHRVPAWRRPRGSCGCGDNALRFRANSAGRCVRRRVGAPLACESEGAIVLRWRGGLLMWHVFPLSAEAPMLDGIFPPLHARSTTFGGAAADGRTIAWRVADPSDTAAIVPPNRIRRDRSRSRWGRFEDIKSELDTAGPRGLDRWPTAGRAGDRPSHPTTIFERPPARSRQAVRRCARAQRCPSARSSFAHDSISAGFSNR